MFFVWAGAAWAAEVTELPPPRSGVAGLRYTGAREAGGLEEAGERVADRVVSRHDLDLFASFGLVPGLAATLALDTTPSLHLAYAHTREMRLDPASGTGSYLAGEPAGQQVIRAGGLEGLWLGVAGAPVSRAAGERAVWRLDAAVRTPSAGRNLWTARNGHRGPAPGGAAVRLAAAFSTDRGAFAPWLRIAYDHELPVRIDVVDEAGTTWAKDLRVAPARTVTASAGSELVALRSDDVRLVVDPSGSAGYRSWEDVASGVYLPNVLDGGRSVPVTRGDTVFAEAGVAVGVAVADRLKIRGGLAATYALPQRLEHLYAVRTTADTVGVRGFLEVTGAAALPSR
ncbi:MAG: hypothetical protein R3F59_35330 [Myxococcota bacterium]